ncbi:hypothetical protein ZIOFF_003566 [Zingiber officinale]|uniref:Ion transport domain-containing protein n=1 Tax=Zingiber officinale TaxID=94328 RepID=A0A8J5IP03_ZINOF|nr:hypothetical protein ZIOFF_003566 [Zingiber officinale]
MTNREDDHAPMLLGNIELPRFTARRASMSMPPSFASEDTSIFHTGRQRIQRAAAEEEKCIVFNWSLAIGIAVVRSVTDFIYLLHMILQFRVAYVAPESRVVGAGDLVYQPKKVALNYLRGYFFLDLFVVLPLPQVMILAVIPDHVGSWKANDANNLLFVTLLLQYFPRIIRFVPLLGGKYASGFIFESAWANFVINLLMFVLAGHVVGSCWYLFGLMSGRVTPHGRRKGCDDVRDLQSVTQPDRVTPHARGEGYDDGRGEDCGTFHDRGASSKDDEDTLPVRSVDLDTTPTIMHDPIQVNCQISETWDIESKTEYPIYSRRKTF